jgi:hypothetical protein
MLAALDPLLCAAVISAAFFSKGVERAIAEQAVELLFGYAFVAWKIFAIPVLKKTAVVFRNFHISCFPQQPGDNTDHRLQIS